MLIASVNLLFFGWVWLFRFWFLFVGFLVGFFLFLFVCGIFVGFLFVFVCFLLVFFLIVAWVISLLVASCNCRLLVLENICSENNEFVFTCAVGKGYNRQRNFD